MDFLRAECLTGKACDNATGDDRPGNLAESDVIIASGNVLLSSEDQSVRADEVRWDRQGGTIYANGSVRIVDEGGNQLFTESVELTDRFEAGAMDELLVTLRAGGRLAARAGARRRQRDGRAA